MTATKPITVAETLPFLRQAVGLWSEDERNAFGDFIAANPEAGDVYFYHDSAMPLYLLLIYAKAQQENWTQDEKRRALALTTAIKQAHRRR